MGSGSLLFLGIGLSDCLRCSLLVVCCQLLVEQLMFALMSGSQEVELH